MKRRLHPVWHLVFALLLLPQPWTPACAQWPESPRPSQPGQDQIVVTGWRPIGTAIGNPLPERQLGPADISAYGANNIRDLINQLTLENRGSGGGIAVVLLNGRRIFNFSEIGDIPPEAILRIDILAEDVARRYGQRVGGKVLNVVLRPNYSTRVAELAYLQGTAGGRESPEGSFTLAGNDQGRRFNLNITAVRNDALLERERPIIGGSGAFRSLLPAIDRLTVTGTMARDRPAGIGHAATARFELRDTVDLTGPGPTFGRPLRRKRQDITFGLNGSVHGVTAGWQWTLAAQAQIAASDITGERARAADFSADSARVEINLEGLANRTIAQLPAGELGLSLRVAFNETGLDSRSTLAGGRLQLSRFRALLSAGLDVPLSSRDLSRGLGEVMFGISGEAMFDDLKRAIVRLESSLNWSPIRPLSVDLRYTYEEEAPSLEDLANPVTVLENQPVFDFVRGETAFVRLRTGGTPSLETTSRETFRAGLMLRPAQGLNLSVIYSRVRASNFIGPYPAITRELELALPSLFIRDAAGRLVEVDQSAINFSQASQDQVRWGLNWNRTIARRQAIVVDETASAREAASALDQNARLNLSVFHTLRIRDQLLVRDGLSRLDFLNGSVAGIGGGRARHQLEVQATAGLGGVGLRLNGSWLSASRAQTSTGEPLTFSSVARFDLRLFADLGHLMPRQRWTSGTRLSLEIGNLLNSRVRIRSTGGAPPAGLQLAYLDPLGRSVRISLRRVF